MAKKQESEKFTGFVGEYTWQNKVAFNFKASPLPTDPFINPYTGVDAGAFLPAKGGGTIFEPPVGQSTVTSNTPPAAKAVRHSRKIVSGIYEIIRPIFNFDFLSHHDCLHYPLLSLRRILNVPVILCHAKCRDNYIKSIRDLKEHAAPCSHNQTKHKTGDHAVFYSRSSALVLCERKHNDSPFLHPPLGVT